MLIYPKHKSTIFENQIFLVAVDGGWNDWSQWSQCTKNVNGIQMRTRQCVNPKPQFGGTLCTGPNSTAMRGCTSISSCRQGIREILKKNFVYYPTPQGFFMMSTVHSLPTAKFLAALLLTGLFTTCYWGAHRSFHETRETRAGNKEKIIKLLEAVLVTEMCRVFFSSNSQEKKVLFLGFKIYRKAHLFLQLRTMTNQSFHNFFLDFSVRFLTLKGFPSHGSMQIFSNGTWKDLCITNWNDTERNLVCQAQGYNGTGLEVYSNSGTNTSGNTTQSCEHLTQNCEKKISREIKCLGIKKFLSPQNKI